MNLNFFSTYLKLLSAHSKVFQGNHYTIEAVKLKLEQAITKDLTRNESDIYVFRGIPLTIEGHTRDTSNGAALAANTHVVHKELLEIVTQTIQDIDKRFSSFIQDQVVTALRMFDPEDTKSLEIYGEDNVPLLYANFSAVLEKKGFDVIEAALEWVDLKKHVGKPPLPFLKLWHSVLSKDSV